MAERFSIIQGAGLLLALALVIVPVSAGSGTVAIPELEVSYGSDLLAPVTIEDSSGLGAVLLEVRYGTLMLEYAGIEPGTLGPDAIIEGREIRPGVIDAGIIDAKGITGSGTLVMLKFRVRDDTDGSSSLIPAVIEAYDTNGNPLYLDTKGGRVVISGSVKATSREPTVFADSTTAAPLWPFGALAAVIVMSVFYRREKEKNFPGLKEYSGLIDQKHERKYP